MYIYIYNFISALLDQLLDEHPPPEEVIKHARTSNWNLLGVQLQLDSIYLAGSHDYTSMYQMWIMEKGNNATRRNLLIALRAIGENGVANLYEKYLKTMVAGVSTQVSTQGITIK